MANAEVIATSTFDNDLEGWNWIAFDNTGVVPNAGQGNFLWAYGGNPGGYARFEDEWGGIAVTAAQAIAPNVFLGDWSAALAGSGVITFDYIDFYDDQVFTNAPVPSVYIQNSSGDQAQFIFQPTAFGEWQSFVAPLIEAAWTVTGDWNDLLSDVTSVRISVDQFGGSLVNGVVQDVNGFDNFTVSVPAPGGVWILLLGCYLIGRRRGNGD